MYNKDFVKIYNEGWKYFSKNSSDNITSEMIANNVLKIMPDCNSVLDLGCGTGLFLEVIEKRVKRTVGVDISKDMIECAKEKCKHTEFFTQSFLDLNLNEKFDVITCNFDTINHLNSISDWEQLFNVAYKHLNKGGIFLFDFNTMYKKENLEYVPYSLTNDKYCFKGIDTKLDPNHIRIFIEIFDLQGNKLAFVDQTESFYEENQVITSLKKTGFKDIKFVDRNFQELKSFKVKRIFALCKN